MTESTMVQSIGQAANVLRSLFIVNGLGFEKKKTSFRTENISQVTSAHSLRLNQLATQAPPAANRRVIHLIWFFVCTVQYVVMFYV